MTTSALVSQEWLEKNIDDSNIFLLEIAGLGQGQKQSYNAGHLPGAHCWDWQTMLWDNLKRDFPSPEDFSERMQSFGINKNTTVIIYGEPMQFGVYAWWTFRYCGHNNVKILDGGKNLWVEKGGSLSISVPQIRQRSIYPNNDRIEHIRTHRDQVLSSLSDPNCILIDGRSREEFQGLRVGAPGNPDTGALRYGRIPGAKHLMFEDLLNPDKSFRTLNEIKELFKIIGIKEDKSIITYCRMSHRATVLFFALTEIADYKNVKVYDGSWTEWGNLVGAPIER